MPALQYALCVAPMVFFPDCGVDITLDADASFSCRCNRHGHRGSQFVGPAGTSWTNSTTKARYQFWVVLHEGCAACFRSSSRIGAVWSIPWSANPPCVQRAIRVGQTSQPFTDADEELTKSTADQRDLIFGRNNRLLFEAGLVSWTDLTTRFTLIDFDHVVFKRGLSVEAMIAAGVPRPEAIACWDRLARSASCRGQEVGFAGQAERCRNHVWRQERMT